jgi:L-alanine-DL-glutamate epimerase-like enolase superfamily enzyme
MKAMQATELTGKDLNTPVWQLTAGNRPQITVTFYKEVWKSLSKTTMEKFVINTGKTTMEEAFLVALSNGADPYKLIKYSYNEVTNMENDNR